MSVLGRSKKNSWHVNATRFPTTTQRRTDARTKAGEHSEEEKEERGSYDSCRIQPPPRCKQPASTTASATLPAPPWDAPSPHPCAAPRSNSPSTRNTT